MMLLAEAYVHQLDPFAIQLTERFGLRWYGLSYAAGFVAAWLIVKWFARTRRSPMNPGTVGDLMTYAIIGVLVGGRVGWAIFYQKGLPLITFSGDFPFWAMFDVMQGGMSSHGGVAGVIVACCLFGHRRGVSKLHLLDMGAMVSTVGLFLGRLANFVNAELWGKALAPERQSFNGGEPPWWSIKYAQEIGLRDYAFMEEVAPLRQRFGGERTFVDQVVAAVQEGDAAVIEVVRPWLTAYYPSQLIQALTDGPLLLAAMLIVWLRPRKPGVVGAWFLIAYGVLRIASERFRQPDEGVALLGGLSRGQVLSVLMVIAGVVAIPLVTRRDVDKLPGPFSRPVAGG